MDYVFHLLILISIYLILAVSLNLLWGYGGLLSFAHAAFFGIGAYSAALLALKLHLPPVVALLAAIALTTLVGILVAILTLRLGGDYFILAMFGFQIIVFDVLYNWVALTRGPFGLYGIPKLSLFGLRITGTFSMFLVTGALAALSYVLAQRLAKAPFGRVLAALREDEIATKALGKDVVRFKISVFALSSAFAALAGGLYAFYFTVLSPDSFTLDESILIFAIVVLGGRGSMAGQLLGVVLLLLFPEALRFLQLPGEVTGIVQQILYGLLLLIFMRLRPAGFLGRFRT